MTVMQVYRDAKEKHPGRTELEKQAYERVLRARVKAPESAILDWIRAIGPGLILTAKLSDILGVASAF